MSSSIARNLATWLVLAFLLGSGFSGTNCIAAMVNGKRYTATCNTPPWRDPNVIDLTRADVDAWLHICRGVYNNSTSDGRLNDEQDGTSGIRFGNATAAEREAAAEHQRIVNTVVPTVLLVGVPLLLLLVLLLCRAWQRRYKLAALCILPFAKCSRWHREHNFKRQQARSAAEIPDAFCFPDERSDQASIKTQVASIASSSTLGLRPYDPEHHCRPRRVEQLYDRYIQLDRFLVAKRDADKREKEQAKFEKRQARKKAFGRPDRYSITSRFATAGPARAHEMSNFSIPRALSRTPVSVDLQAPSGALNSRSSLGNALQLDAGNGFAPQPVSAFPGLRCSDGRAQSRSVDTLPLYAAHRDNDATMTKSQSQTTKKEDVTVASAVLPSYNSVSAFDPGVILLSVFATKYGIE
ncbi:hypothetical protein K437DRAFT_270465 [Tilletiaria anomala UBC 951]|uniref:Uncharacterized protein n=1 Tax=Tilletiaria anomala (strain ATCC 24038 / CBS 436.72 / UBC 951) TaxID=1037660 RepID=A0A066VEQ7_TILAU|nr:uncharacterized protein K437DRAFT_270465 [Tilletiaria anomala UBC 951]KDN38783.1 hypothetical protein K437DRAFT_270465 [Tilletiaria anomala UBC 951]